MNAPLRLGLKLGQDAPISSFRRIWQIADEAGFDHCWCFDHLASVGPIGIDKAVFDGWTMLGAMAVATTRPRLGLLVTGVSYRNPAMLAKQAVTVDHLSGGRLEFGLGAGWAAEEYEMYGIDGMAHRVGKLAEALTMIRLLWTSEVATFSGRHYHLNQAVAEPKPLQRPTPPIWVGAAGPLTMRLAARHADVWNLVGDAGTTPALAAARRASEQFEQACGEVGREPSEVRRSVQLRFDGGDTAPLESDLLAFHEAGFTEIIVYVGGSDPVAAGEAVAERVLPLARARQSPPGGGGELGRESLA